MSIETVQREADFVLRSSRDIDLLRFHVADEEMIITSGEYRGMLTIASVSDMKALRDWLTRRLEEPRP